MDKKLPAASAKIPGPSSTPAAPAAYTTSNSNSNSNSMDGACGGASSSSSSSAVSCDGAMKQGGGAPDAGEVYRPDFAAPGAGAEELESWMFESSFGQFPALDGFAAVDLQKEMP